MMKLITNPITLYRGITSRNLPERYPGKYYTQNKELAKWYAKDGGTVHSIQFVPKNVLSIDQLLTNQRFKEEILSKFNKFFSNKSEEELENLQLYDNLFNNITDFSFPTKDDNEFLKSLGYDSVYFSHEGGQRVDSWYLF